jgi:hypothetical protein
MASYLVKHRDKFVPLPAGMKTHEKLQEAAKSGINIMPHYMWHPALY